MTWLEYLENMNISFKVYTLEPEDSIIITNLLQNNKLVIILDGFAQLLKIFTNRESLCIKLLKANNIIELHSPKGIEINYYHKAIAIIKTTILSIPLQELRKKISKTQESIKTFIKLYIYSYISYDIMINILCHRNTKKRIIQLLLILLKEFGESKPPYIVIPFYLSHNTISIITGSHRVNITRIMNELKKKKLIAYNKQQFIIHNPLKLSQY